MSREEHLGVDFEKLLVENPLALLTCGEPDLRIGPAHPGSDKSIKHGEFSERLVRGRFRRSRRTAEHEDCEPHTARRKCQLWRGHAAPLPANERHRSSGRDERHLTLPNRAVCGSVCNGLFCGHSRPGVRLDLIDYRTRPIVVVRPVLRNIFDIDRGALKLEGRIENVQDAVARENVLRRTP